MKAKEHVSNIEKVVEMEKQIIDLNNLAESLQIETNHQIDLRYKAEKQVQDISMYKSQNQNQNVIREEMRSLELKLE